MPATRLYCAVVFTAALASALSACETCTTEGGGGQVGPEGVSMSMSGCGLDRASINIPPGALASTVLITSSYTYGSVATGLPVGVAPAGPLVVFGPEGQTFLLPVTISLQTQSPTAVMYTRPVGGTTWTVVPGATFDPSTNHLRVSVLHLSEFAPGSR